MKIKEKQIKFSYRLKANLIFDELFVSIMDELLSIKPRKYLMNLFYCFLFHKASSYMFDRVPNTHLLGLLLVIVLKQLLSF